MYLGAETFSWPDTIAFLGLIVLVTAHLALVGRHRLHGAEAVEGSSPEFLRRLGLALVGAAGLLATLAFVFPVGIGLPPDAPNAPAAVKPLWMFLPMYQAAKVVSGPWTLLLMIVPPAFLVAIPFLPRRVAIPAMGVFVAVVIALGVNGAVS